MILLTASGVMAALALVAAAATGAGGGPAIRADNKSDAVLAVAVLSDGYPYRPDQQFFGMRMAALEINNLSTLLPGATLNVQRVTLPPMSQLAAIYDKAVDICDSRNFSFLAGNLRSSTTYATTIVCPNIPFVSTLSSAPVLSDKTRFPLFFRYTHSFAQSARASISHFKYFGWSKVGLVVSNTGILPDLRAMYFSMFSESGINILANVLIPAYNPAISRLYYPQIRQPFEFLKASRLRIFVACIDAAQMIDIMLAANQTGLVGRDYVWATNQFISVYDMTISQRWDVALDPKIMRGVSLITSENQFIAQDPVVCAWTDRFRERLAEALARETGMYTDINMSQTDASQQDYPGSLFLDDPGTDNQPSLFVTSAYDAVWATAYAFDEIITESNSTARALANGLLDSQVSLGKIIGAASRLQAISGVSMFQSNGDPLREKMILLQFTGTSFSIGGTVKAAIILLNATTLNSSLVVDKGQFLWAGVRDFSDTPIDYPLADEDFVSWDWAFTRAIVGICVIMSMSCTATAVFVWLARNSSQLRPMCPSAMIAIAISLGLIQSSPIALIGKHKPVSCAIQLWLAPFGTMLLIITILVKNLQLFFIFRLAMRTRSKTLEWMLAAKNVALFSAILTAVACTPFMFVTWKAPSKSQLVYIDDSDTYKWVCKSPPESHPWIDIGFALMLIVAICAGVLVAMNGNLPKQLNDSLNAHITLLVVTLNIGVGIARFTTPSSGISQITQEFCLSIVTVGVAGYFMLWRRIYKTVRDQIQMRLAMPEQRIALK
ncbi:hypothetical protein HK105_202101 [Polyrhizophydium stewartii]|uniref:G-protein coupled receptors family 3 profile domain-containing protein n=1 Tax=Polyrhizophydium stewartii TaxID=2732419 RepID=A0ABR4NF63_9FUNG